MSDIDTAKVKLNVIKLGGLEGSVVNMHYKVDGQTGAHRGIVLLDHCDGWYNFYVGKNVIFRFQPKDIVSVGVDWVAVHVEGPQPKPHDPADDIKALEQEHQETEAKLKALMWEPVTVHFGAYWSKHEFKGVLGHGARYRVSGADGQCLCKFKPGNVESIDNIDGETIITLRSI